MLRCALHDLPGYPKRVLARVAFLKSSLTLQPQPTRTMLQTRYFFGYYYFYATA
jgi:hypothetical protein